MENMFLSIKRKIKLISVISCVLFVIFSALLATIVTLKLDDIIYNFMGQKFSVFLIVLLCALVVLSFHPFIFGFIFLGKNKDIVDPAKVKNLSLLEFGIFYSKLSTNISSSFREEQELITNE